MHDLPLNENIRDIQIMNNLLLVPEIAVEGVILGVIHSVHRLILIFRIYDYVRTLNNILKIQFLLTKSSPLLERPVG